MTDEQEKTLIDLFVFERQSDKGKIGYTKRMKKIINERRLMKEFNPLEGLNEFEDDIYLFESKDVSSQTMPGFYLGE